MAQRLDSRAGMTAPLPRQTPSLSSPQAEDKLSKFNREKDSLYILPLSIIPLETPSLKRARLLKDARLNSVVELFHDLAEIPQMTPGGCRQTQHEGRLGASPVLNSHDRPWSALDRADGSMRNPAP